MGLLKLSESERNAIFSIRNYIYLQELLQVASGIKPVARFGYEKESDPKNLIPKIISDLGLEVLICKERTCKPSEKIIYIGRSLNAMRAAHEASVRKDFCNLGNLLGYPECCIDSFISAFRNSEISRMHTLPYSHKNKLEVFDYRTNNIYNAQSYGNAAVDKFYEYIKGFFDYTKYFFISHIPCSYKCSESVKIAEKTKNLMDKNFYSMSDNIKNHLQRGFIVFDMLEFIIISYVIGREEINYTIYLTSPLVKEKNLSNFKEGGCIKIKDENSIELYKDGERIKEAKCKIILFG